MNPIETQLVARRRTRDSARGSNGRQPVRWCSNRTSVATRLSLRTPDGESHETVHSALWHRGVTARTRVLTVMPSGAYPRLLSRVPIAPAPDVLRRWRRSPPSEHRPSSGRGKARAHTPTAPVAGGRLADMVRFVNMQLGVQGGPPVDAQQVLRTKILVCASAHRMTTSHKRGGLRYAES